MEWNSATVSLLTTGVLALHSNLVDRVVVAAQSTTSNIGSAQQPDFRRELDRIFRDSP